ncbi:MAG TPA: hypothetical protein DCL44_05910 [Elusimicrobia bacterium]|nr:hypothetical protein [Elusimicrobiota bacterium]
MKDTKVVLCCAAAAVCVLLMQDTLFAAKLKDFKKVVIADFSYEQLLSDQGNSKGSAADFGIGEIDGKPLYVNPKYFLREALAEFTSQLKAGGLEVVDPAEAQKAFGLLKETKAPKEAAESKGDKMTPDTAMSKQQEAMQSRMAAMEPKLKEMEKTNPAAAAKIRASMARAMGGAQEQMASAVAGRPDESVLKTMAANIKKNKETEEATTEPEQFVERGPQDNIHIPAMEDLNEMANNAKNDKAKKKTFAEVMQSLGADAYIKVSFNGGITGQKTSTLNIKNQFSIQPRLYGG